MSWRELQRMKPDKKIPVAQAEAYAVQAYHEGRADGLSEGLENVGDFVERITRLEHKIEELERRLDALEELKAFREAITELRSRLGTLESYILGGRRPPVSEESYH